MTKFTPENIQAMLKDAYNRDLKDVMVWVDDAIPGREETVFYVHRKAPPAGPEGVLVGKRRTAFLPLDISGPRAFMLMHSGADFLDEQDLLDLEKMHAPSTERSPDRFDLDCFLPRHRFPVMDALRSTVPESLWLGQPRKPVHLQKFMEACRKKRVKRRQYKLHPRASRRSQIRKGRK